MNCKIKRTFGFLIYCGAAYLAVKYINPVWAGYGMMITLAALGAVALFLWLASALGHTRTPYYGAQVLRQKARRIAADDGVDINTAAQEVWVQAKEKGETTQKKELVNRGAHVGIGELHGKPEREIQTPDLPEVNTIIVNKPARPKDSERFGVVQQPELPAGNEVEGIWVEVSENQSIRRNS